MKKTKITGAVASMMIVLSISCSTDFIEEKRDYSSIGEEIYTEPVLATQYLDYLYYSILPARDQNMAMYTLTADEHDGGDDFSQASDEVAGEVDFNIEWSTISPLNNHALRSIGTKLTSSSSRNDAWTRIRYCNLYLDNVDNYTGLEEGFKDKLKGQFYFWRAWQYFELVRLYGGVPLILEPQDPNIDDPSNQIPRSSSEETINQIVADLDMARSLLEEGEPYTADDAGRITAEAAAALKGRVLLTWASPLFNRSDDVDRWQRSYDANLEAYNVALEAGKGLNPDWRNMWFQDYNMESIMSFGFNDDDTGGQLRKNNATERYSRPKDLGATGGNSPTKQIVDAFPMNDGTAYDPEGEYNDFYKNRDPRFYHTFAFNGGEWPYAENQDFKMWTYYWRTTPGGEPARSTENSPNATGIYLKKFTNPNTSELDGFRYSGADYMEIRFAEVVLNLAESSIGIGNLAEGKARIMEIRERAGIEDLDGQYGLSNVNTRDEHFAAVINERKVEFAYENKRFHDLRRWLLYDDTYGTVTRLNQEPIDGSRRKGYYIIAKDYFGDEDPFLGEDAPVVSREPESYPDGISNHEEYLDYLYENHFEVIVRDDVDPIGFTFKWYDEYYFWGIYQDLIDTAPYLEQTQGWGGAFDPLQ